MMEENIKFYLTLVSIKDYLERCYNSNAEVDIVYLVQYIEGKLINDK